MIILSQYKFIVVEGVDFSGKSTYIRNLKEKIMINNPNKKILDLHFIGHNMKNVLQYKDSISPNSLFHAIIHEMKSLNHIIKDCIDNDILVISDRYVYSTMVYQTKLLVEASNMNINNLLTFDTTKIDSEEFMLLYDLFFTESSMYNLIRPDAIVYLHPDFYIIQERIENSKRELDFIEKDVENIFKYYNRYEFIFELLEKYTNLEIIKIK